MAKNKHTYNKFFTEEKWLKVNKYNKDAMEDFLLELKAQKKSDKTIYQYKSDLRIFFIWILETYDNCPIYKLKKKQLRNFVLEMSDKGMSSNRVNRMKSVVSSLLSYLEDDEDYEEVEMNYMSKVKSVQKKLVRDIIFLSSDQVDIIRNRLLKDEKYQICLLWDLLSETGARHNEVYQIQKDWIKVENNYTTHKVIGKRSKDFYICIQNRTKESYKLYMNQRGEDDIPELWLNANKKPCSYDALYEWILYCRKILQEETGEYVPFNLHSLRHYFIDGMIKGYHHLCDKYGRKFTLQEVQAMVSHSSSETTSQYMNNDETEIVSGAFGW